MHWTEYWLARLVLQSARREWRLGTQRPAELQRVLAGLQFNLGLVDNRTKRAAQRSEIERLTNDQRSDRTVRT